MEKRQLLYSVVLLVFLVTSSVSAKGTKFQCECSLNENRCYSHGITCSNQQKNEGSGVGCTKEERTRISPGYRYIPGYGLYKLYHTAHYWTKARDLCEKDGGRLAIPRDLTMASTLWDLFKYDVYVGISDAASEGAFTDVNGKLPPFLNWKPGEPNGDKDENCVVLKRGGFMYDVNCGQGRYFLCERHFTEALPDGYEYIDNYGFFKIHTDKANFADAEDTCQSEGGHLFLLETYEEAEAILAFVRRDPRNLNPIWTGLNDTQTEGEFVTYSGQSVEELEFKNWNYGEPNDDHGGEDCAFFYEDGTINDERCYLKFNFICEIPAPCNK